MCFKYLSIAFDEKGNPYFKDYDFNFYFNKVQVTDVGKPKQATKSDL